MLKSLAAVWYFNFEIYQDTLKCAMCVSYLYEEKYHLHRIVVLKL